MIDRLIGATSGTTVCQGRTLLEPTGGERRRRQPDCATVFPPSGLAFGLAPGLEVRMNIEPGRLDRDTAIGALLRMSPLDRSTLGTHSLRWRRRG